MTKCRNTKKLCMFCQCTLIMYTFLTPTTSHIFPAIQCIPCPLELEAWLTFWQSHQSGKLNVFLPVGINPHTHKHFCLSSSSSFFAYSLLATWLLIMHSFLLFSNFKKKISKALRMCFEHQCHLLLCEGCFWHIVAQFWKLLCEI